MLVKACFLRGADNPVDVRCVGSTIAQIGHDLVSTSGEIVLDGSSAEILSSLIDHHIHLLATAAARSSTKCGPPEVNNADQLRSVLQQCQPDGWIRGVGYHESVAGELNRRILDMFCQNQPLRIQHRSGKMWYLNTRALELLELDTKSDGKLFRQDELLRSNAGLNEEMAGQVRLLSDVLARFGVTEVTDATPSNDMITAEFLRKHMVNQKVSPMGNMSLDSGWHKIMLDEYQLPELDELSSQISLAHEKSRPIAIHCVTRTELVFALVALEEAGVLAGDRIEHASVVDADTLKWIAKLGLSVATQPNFIYERGDSYIADVQPDEHASLYLCRRLLNSGIPVVGSTDAPFGDANPWIGIQAATSRTTFGGQVLNQAERMNIDDALALYTSNPFTGEDREIKVGNSANFVLVDKNWRNSESIRTGDHVLATVYEGGITYGFDL